MMRALVSAAALTAMASVPAWSLELSKSVTVDAPPAKVWQTVGQFCGIGDWHPAVASCTLSSKDGKKVRTLQLKGGGTIMEEQVSRSNKRMRYTYIILSSPLPVQNYKSTISVMPEGSGTRLTWEGHFEAKGAPDDKAKDVIGGIYDAGLKGISDKTTGQ